MKVQLIPVIEITNYDDDIQVPLFSPYWEFPDEWQDYHMSANIKAGFSGDMKPYVKGFSLYKITEISDADLLKVIHKEIEIQQADEDSGTIDLNCSLAGGYVLNIDGSDCYFPQCCADLGDIEDWEDLLDDDHSYFYMGHPSPAIEKYDHKIILDFLNSEIQENYAPPVSDHRIEVDKEALKIAVDHVKKELHAFAQRLLNINQTENLNIPEIDKILMYGTEQ